VRRHPEAITFPGLLIWRPGGDLFFGSIGYLLDGLRDALAESQPPARRVLLDLDSVSFMDTTACDALSTIITDIRSRGTSVAFARVRDSVRERLQRGGIEATVGAASFHERVTDGVRAWERDRGVDGGAPGAGAAPVTGARDRRY